MAWALSLDCSTATLSLVSDTGIKILREQFVPTVGSDKTETGLTTDAYRCFINSDTVTNLRALIQSVNVMTTNARARQERNAGPRVYLTVTEDGSADAWRSEVLDGDFVPDKINNPNWTNGEAWGTLYLTRRNWFEGPETDLTLSNINSSGTTAGLVVYLTNDGDSDVLDTFHNNYADILGSEITGDLPGFGIATILTISPIQYLYTQYGRTADTTVWFHETGTSTADVTASDGSYEVTAISSSAAVIGPGSVTAQYTGANYRIIARLGLSLGAGTYRVVPRVTVGQGNDEYLNPVYITPSDSAMHVYPLGVANIQNYTDSDVYVNATVYAPSGDVYSDFVMAAPADCVRDYKLSSVSSTAVQGTITDDTVLDDLSTTLTSAAAGRLGMNINVTGSNKILLYPGINQTVYFCGEPWERTTYIAFFLKYRPRRSSL